MVRFLRGPAIFGGIFLLVLSGNASLSEPGPTIDHLMNDPVSMLDLGIMRMELRLNQDLQSVPLLGMTFINSYTGYEWEKNRIVIGATFGMGDNAQIADLSAAEVCNRALSRISFAIGAMFGMEAAAVSALEAYFTHNGFMRSNQPKDLGKKLLSVLVFEARIVQPDQSIFDKTEPDCRREWTEGMPSLGP